MTIGPLIARLCVPLIETRFPYPIGRNVRGLGYHFFLRLRWRGIRTDMILTRVYFGNGCRTVTLFRCGPLVATSLHTSLKHVWVYRYSAVDVHARRGG